MNHTQFIARLNQRANTVDSISQLQVGQCPSCGEQAIHKTESGYECFHCHQVYTLEYKASSKPNCYTGNLMSLIPQSEIESVAADETVLRLFDQYYQLAQKRNMFGPRSAKQFVENMALRNLGGFSLLDSARSVLTAWIWNLETPEEVKEQLSRG